MKRKNLRSEAALADVLTAIVAGSDWNASADLVGRDVIVSIWLESESGIRQRGAEISARDHIKKRRGLKGIKAVLSGKRKKT